MSQSYSFYRRLNGVFGHRLPDRAAAAGISARRPPRLLCAMRYGALGASSRLRLAQYRPYLEQAGIRTEMRSFLGDDYLQALYGNSSRFGAVARAYVRALGAPLAARSNDILWIEKEFLPWLPYALERRAIGATPYILDFDDAWSLRYEQSKNPLVRRLLGEKFRRLLRGAALTVTANDTLFAWARAEGAGNILRLPTVIDLDLYRPRPEPDGPFTLGWVGTPLTAAYLDVIAGPLKILAAEAPLRLLVIGAPEVRIPGVDCVHLPWSADTEAEDLAGCHVGLMPLPDDDWARGKSGYKIIQYMAMARPAVASAIGANNQIIEPGQTGFLAGTPAAWLTHLRALRDDPTLRQNLGTAARLRVERHFSLQVTAPILIANINAILTKP